MSKTLSESAAEILKASMSAAKEPAKKLPAEMDDLGGSTTTKPEGDEIGKKAAANVSAAAKPAAKGDAKAAKVQAMEETEASEEEVVAEESEEEIADLDSEVVIEAKEKDEEEDEEEIKEAKKAMMKDMVKKHKGSMKEDVDALFNGESLSEDFRVKATLIFESAVTSRVEAIVEEVLDENDALLEAAVAEIQSELSEQVDEYLNYVVEQWVEENKVAIETGLKAELVEDFINGLKNLFAEHYIEIPEEKVDVTEELAARVAALEEEVATRDAVLSEVNKELNKGKKETAIIHACEGLTQVQAEKLKSLAEGVEFTTEGDFANKLAVIRENYFPTKTNVTSEIKAAQDASEAQPQEEVDTGSVMEYYVKAISKQLPK
jgi:hypothetical protein